MLENCAFTIRQWGMLLLVLMVMIGCSDKTVYYHYEPTPIAGWEKNDNITFLTAPMAQEGIYNEALEMRVTTEFPFTKVVMVCEQTILPAGETRSDTVICELTDKHGIPQGSGVSCFQYRFPIKPLSLKKGDKLSVAVRHDMKREILPGVCDIGFHISNP